MPCLIRESGAVTVNTGASGVSGRLAGACSAGPRVSRRKIRHFSNHLTAINPAALEHIVAIRVVPMIAVGLTMGMLLALTRRKPEETFATGLPIRSALSKEEP